jgi:sigma-B regulation protein RsbU (phosphoserine phosphatase)
MLLLFTDGLFEVEGADGQVYDYDRLLHAVDRRSNLPIKDMCRGVVSEVQEFSPNREFTDDVCLVGMQVDKCGELLVH